MAWAWSPPVPSCARSVRRCRCRCCPPRRTQRRRRRAAPPSPWCGNWASWAPPERQASERPCRRPPAPRSPCQRPCGAHRRAGPWRSEMAVGGWCAVRAWRRPMGARRWRGPWRGGRPRQAGSGPRAAVAAWRCGSPRATCSSEWASWGWSAVAVGGCPAAGGRWPGPSARWGPRGTDARAPPAAQTPWRAWRCASPWGASAAAWKSSGRCPWGPSEVGWNEAEEAPDACASCCCEPAAPASRRGPSPSAR
mmetsp:Transcript_13351/g.34621  ORF Transcript_13351/g.34621 Transcript_13351/m.34621 type:complete len:251 (+) Transcript_13351:1086-1838(+)